MGDGDGEEKEKKVSILFGNSEKLLHICGMK
jgi:hypothetical protein